MARWFRDRSPRHGIPAISLRHLLPEARFVGCRDLEVSGCSSDSRRLEPGELFIAIRGDQYDGHDFAVKALKRGAAAVMVDRLCPETGPLQVVVPDTRSAHGRLCQALAGEPSKHLSVIAVAGAIGRTPTAHYLRAIVASSGLRYGHVGALGWSDGCRDYPASPAEPGCAVLADMLAAMVERGCDGAIIELSPESMRHRVMSGLRLQAAIITDVPRHSNATTLMRDRDRLAHARLVRGVVPGGWTVVPSEDVEAELLGATNLASRRVAYGMDELADVKAILLGDETNGTHVRLTGFGCDFEAALPRRGAGNLRHAMGAAAVALAQGLTSEAVREGLESVETIPGHLEKVCAGQPFHVFIDRAREEAQLLAAIGEARSMTSGRLICMLSTSDAEGLPVGLARACEDRTDQVVLTLDNVHSQTSDLRLDEALTAFRRPGRVRVEVDRERAIESTLQLARLGDSVLILGGRQPALRVFHRQPIACSDRNIVIRLLQQFETRITRLSA